MPLNILYIVVDQLQARCLGCMGHPTVQTPNLDRLAAGGVVFAQAFTPSPVCMAARGSLMTGRCPAAIGIRGMGVLPPWETTTATVLKRRGYCTGAFGKTHLTPELYTRQVLQSDVPILDCQPFLKDAAIPPVADPDRFQYGFTEHVGCDDHNRGNHQRWLAEIAPELLAKEPERPFAAPGDLWVSPHPSEYHHSTYIANLTADFIRRRNGTPWFAFCGFIHPHHPFEAPADQLTRYAVQDLPLPRIRQSPEAKAIPAPIADAIGECEQYSEEVMRTIIHHYLASISLIDDNVGRLLEVLEDTGQQDNTIVVFTGDHGEFLGERQLLRKPSMHYDELIRVPLVISAPGVPAARTSSLVELTDLHPTVLGLADVDINPGVQGCDWSKALRAGDTIDRESISSDMHNLAPMLLGEAYGSYGAVQTLRTSEWKLNIYPEAGPDFGQLFDLINDPDELCNRYPDPSCRSVRDDLFWRLHQRNFADLDPLPIRLSQW